MKIKNIFNRLFLTLLVLVVFSCKKFVEVPGPYTSTSSENVYKDNISSSAVLNGIYAKMADNRMTFGGITSISLFAGLSSDEFTLATISAGAGLQDYYQNSLQPESVLNIWDNTYSLIYVCNSAIEGLKDNKFLTINTQKQLLGEAKFMRAFFYFYLVNLYNEVPLVLSTDYKVNSSLPKSSKNIIYSQIIGDLQEAKLLLPAQYVDGFGRQIVDRTRPNLWAATALLARVYLYSGNNGDNSAWSKAESESSLLINNSALFDLPSTNLDKVFLKNSKEAIWQLEPISPFVYNTYEALTFIIPSTGINSDNPVCLSNSFMNSFEVGDQRKNQWIGKYSETSPAVDYYYPHKYKENSAYSPVTEYSMVLRVAEQYLIRAEARARQNNVIGGESDVNIIRRRAGLSDLNLTTQSSLLLSISKERRIELFSEWGHRWLDLKRLGEVDDVMKPESIIKGSSWSAYKAIYPIPLNDILNDPNLKQNSGYN
jgi:hypothetical protein